MRHRWVLFAAVFVASASVLVLEIVAGRILAPYVGVSLQTFTGIIGTILAAIAVGAWVGGTLADRHDPSRLLGPALIVGGILAVVSPALVYVIGPSASGEEPLTIVTLAAIGFFLPAASLSTVTPIAAKMSLASLDDTGSVVGQLSAVGTAGALFGTFVTGFVLIAAIPSRPITWVVGTILLAFGIAMALPWGRSLLVSALAVFALAVMASSALAAPCDHETAYSCAVVVDRGEGSSVRALVLDTFVNSVVDTSDPTFLGSRYARTVQGVVASQIPDGPRSIAFIGGGGFTLPRYYHATSGATATVLEIDRALRDIAVDELGLDDGPWLDVVVGDARVSFLQLPTQAFDLVVGDAFSGRSVPWHLTTREFVDQVRQRLAPGGLYVINVIDHPPTRFARAEAATIAEVFPHVAVVAPADYFDGTRGGNFVIAGSDTVLDAATVAGLLVDGETVLVDDEVRAWIADARILVDDFAPADQLLSRP
jgi:spermidine synthase